MTENNKYPYSYHTFVFPFIWRCWKEKNSLEEFRKCFDKSPYWKVDKLGVKKESSTEQLSEYKEYEYFYPFVRKAMYKTGEQIVENYKFVPMNDDFEMQYIISKNEIKYELIINAIRLKIFNTGVAFFILECENYENDSIDAVKNINDWGRRINLPFIPDKAEYSICADSLEIKIGKDLSKPLEGKETISFKNNFNNFIVNEKRPDLKLSYIPEFIKGILGFRLNEVRCISVNKFTSTESSLSESEIYIYPALDDRMFVLSAISDERECKRATRYFFNACVSGKEYELIEKNLYELAFVDNTNGCTCVNPNMRAELLEKAIYPRWIDSEDSTIYTIANQGMMMLSTASMNDMYYLYESFLTQYYDMACLVLAERVSIVRFKKELADISSSIIRKKKMMDRKALNKILDLQERFIAFQNQLCFAEVTPQEQGIEMFNMLKEAMKVESEINDLKEQINSLYEVANTMVGYDLNKIAYAFTFISAGLAVGTIFFDFFESVAAYRFGNEAYSIAIFINEHRESITIIIITILVAIFIWFYSKWKFRR